MQPWRACSSAFCTPCLRLCGNCHVMTRSMCVVVTGVCWAVNVMVINHCVVLPCSRVSGEVAHGWHKWCRDDKPGNGCVLEQAWCTCPALWPYLANGWRLTGT